MNALTLLHTGLHPIAQRGFMPLRGSEPLDHVEPRTGSLSNGTGAKQAGLEGPHNGTTTHRSDLRSKAQAKRRTRATGKQAVTVNAHTLSFSAPQLSEAFLIEPLSACLC